MRTGKIVGFQASYITSCQKELRLINEFTCLCKTRLHHKYKILGKSELLDTCDSAAATKLNSFFCFKLKLRNDETR